MALPSTITINGITIDVDDTTCSFDYQPNTISAALIPDRSRYGTLQQPGVPSTNTAKLIWVISGAFVTDTQMASLKSMAAANSTFTYSFTDNLWATLINGSSYATNVRFIKGDPFVDAFFTDKRSNTGIFRVNFSALEI